MSLKVAVLGYGHLGKWHCDKVEQSQKGATLYAIVESFKANAEAAQQKFPKTKVVDDIKKVINEIDAAVIVTPTSTHFELAKYLLENGKHVFCEKPLCNTYEEVEELKSYIKSKNQVLQVGHSERFHLAWEQVTKFIENEKSTIHIRINRMAPFKGRATDVDVVQDLMIHDLDLVTYLLDSLPVSLRAHGKKIRTNKYDFAVVDLFYKNGSTVSISASRNHVKEVRELELYTKNGCLNVDMFQNSIQVATGSNPGPEFVKEEKYPKRDHLMLEHQCFYESILKKTPAIVAYEDGRKAVYLVEKTIEAISSGVEVTVEYE
ncbi:MAG: Gfo/Idh/MocA family oxidoreductase [Bacteriovoracaceae bacterium]|nr:Gfo/Idh/MocA family oxidoreductase [Bacteriovoracaceae bacterium]